MGPWSLRREARRLCVDDSGATATEYAVMLALILVVILVSVTTFGTTLSTEYTDINDTMFQ
jgi:pilus assembly protein Flp/PilA